MTAATQLQADHKPKTAQSGLCNRPQRYWNPDTGEVVSGRCNATTMDKCPSCASLYAADITQQIAAGIGQTTADESVYLVTLTAPPFWKPLVDNPQTHRFHKEYFELRSRLKPNSRKINAAYRKALCPDCTKQARNAAKAAGRTARSASPVVHGPNDPLAGLPVDLDQFDYAAAAQWSWHLGERWHRYVTALSRVAGSTTQFIKVVELQRRGVAHIHAVIRGTNLTEAAIEAAIEATYLSPDKGGGWGDIYDIQPIRLDGPGATIGKVSRYLAKYLTKLSAASLDSAAAEHPHARRHFTRLRNAAHTYASQHATSRPGGPCPEPHCVGTLKRGSTQSNYLKCSRVGLPGQAPHTFQNRVPYYTNQLAIRARRATSSRQWARIYRPSKLDPNHYKPLVRKDGRPIHLTRCHQRETRRRFARTQNPRTESNANWIRLPTGTSPPT